jgi:hypothetical protein
MSNGEGVEWPEWWEWELELSPHLFRRMRDRGFSETDLRTMLQEARGFHPSHEEGRFVIESVRDNEPWEIVVEPDEAAEVLIVVTAYRVG